MIVVSDTSPISNLLKIGQIELLHELFHRVIIPNAVWEELSNVTETADAIASTPWIDVVVIDDADIQPDLVGKLDRGEAHAISLALKIDADYILIDEITGRIEAESFGLRIVGILGILLEAKERGLISRIEPVIESLLSEARFWLSADLVEKTLRRAGER